jgi:hypothetical protein
VKYHKNGMSRECHTCGREEKYIQGFGGEKLKEIGRMETHDVDGRIILKRILKKRDRCAWTGFIWLRVQISGRLL